jgi:hypothetical protein
MARSRADCRDPGGAPVTSGQAVGLLRALIGESIAAMSVALFVTCASRSPPESCPFCRPVADTINGSGLSALNYYFVQAPGNATALTVDLSANNPTSQSTPPGNNPLNPGTNISCQNFTGSPINISFTPTPHPVNSATNRPDEVVTSALPPGSELTGDHGFNYRPISQYDANQYSQFKVPDYADRDSEATIFTIIACAIAADHAADYLIDTVWTGTAGDWKGTNGDNSLTGRVTFSDGAGHAVAPTDTDALPLVARTTDLGQLLMSGDGQTPAHWLLAIKLTNDGKGIVADDTISGKEVVLSYSQNTNTVGGVTGIYDAKTKGFVSLADASGDMPAGSGGPAGLQSLVARTSLP